MIKGSKMLRCFVACAFGREDVDAIYDEILCPTLLKYGIEPIRVDRHEHNDDIDNKIFELLNSADLCMADLTYARPSVYYEAGFASGRGKPVIYTARKDHLHPKPKDKEGNLKVHFDLQMKNIICWSKANKEFAKKLLRRIQHVCEPLRKKAEIEGRYDNARLSYSKLAVSSQLALLRQEFNKNALGARFTSSPVERYNNDWQRYYYRKQGSKLCVVQFVALPSVTKSAIARFAYGISPDYAGLAHERVVRYIIVASLGGGTQSAIGRYLASWTPLGDKVFSRQRDYGSKTESTMFQLFDKVRSPEELFDQVKPLLKRIAQNKNDPLIPLTAT